MALQTYSAGLQDYYNRTSRPGETGQAYEDRTRAEFMAQQQQQRDYQSQLQQMQQQQTLANDWQAALTQRNLPGTPGMTTPAMQAENDAKLERERQLAFGALSNQANFYDRGTAAELEQTLLGGMRGQNNPFSPEVISNLVGSETDAEAAQLRSEQNMIRSRMANSGLGGSGLDASARINAQRKASKRSRAASRDIRTRAELENAQFRERKEQALASFVNAEAANRAAQTRQEVELRSRMQVLGNDYGMDKLAAALAPQQQPRAAMPIQTSGRITGNEPKAQYGGVTWLNGSGVNPFRQTTESTGYQQFGLGGSAGPFGAIAQAGRIADRNMAQRNDTGYASGTNWLSSQNTPNQALGGGSWGMLGPQSTQAPATRTSPFALGGDGTSGSAPWRNASVEFLPGVDPAWDSPYASAYDQRQANSSRPTQAGTWQDYMGRQGGQMAGTGGFFSGMY